jgi:glucosylceramidase
MGTEDPGVIPEDAMAVTIHVDRGQVHQRIDGFGFCQAFGRAHLLRGAEGLPPGRCREVLDLLFRTDVGAGLSILRLGIGSTTDGGQTREGQMRSIAPVDPGGPDEPLKYEWDGDDNGQVWLARQATTYGVRRFYANAWSAPGYMMENGTDINGGAVRGTPGTPPALGDWRPAYARYLLQYVRLYRECGVEITDLGFANEADLIIHTPGRVLKYAHMRLEPQQVVDLVKVVGPAIERSGLAVSLLSCDATTWSQATSYTAAVEADPEAAPWVKVYTGHNYDSPARNPLPTIRPTWMSEWDPDVTSQNGGWNDRWDGERRCDGIRLAEDINDAFTMAGISGYLYWFGVSTGNTRALIQADGPDYRVSKRFWAVAAYSRFIRPGAHRVATRVSGATGSGREPAAVKAVAFQNATGELVINVLNLSAAGVAARLDVNPTPGPAMVDAWLTDEAHSLTPAGARSASTVNLPARSLTSLVLRRPGRLSGRKFRKRA